MALTVDIEKVKRGDSRLFAKILSTEVSVYSSHILGNERAVYPEANQAVHSLLKPFRCLSAEAAHFWGETEGSRSVFPPKST